VRSRRPLASARPTPGRRAAVALAIGLLLIPSALFPANLRAPPSSGPAPPAWFTTDLKITNASIGVQTGTVVRAINASFWGADVTPDRPLGTTETKAWSAAHLTLVRWPGGAFSDRFDVTHNRIYFDDGSYVAADTSTAQFVTWCKSLHCQAIVGLPGELNNASLAKSYVSYIENQLSFHPAFWEIGNEPALWDHFGIRWSHWTSSQEKNATPSTYATMVANYSAAIHAVDPKAKIIGLSGVGTGGHYDRSWITATVRKNGPVLAAVAIHVYPAGLGNVTDPTLSGFFSTLRTASSLYSRAAPDLAAIRAACPNCSKIDLFATEINSASGGGGKFATYMAHFPEVPYMAANLIQGLTGGLAGLETYLFEGSYPGGLLDHNGTPRPLATFYDRFLPYFGNEIVASTLTTNDTGLYAVAMRQTASSNYSLFVSNVGWATVSLRFGGLPVSSGGVRVLWSSGTTAPTVTRYTTTVPTSWSIPGRSVGILEVASLVSPVAPPPLLVLAPPAGAPSQAQVISGSLLGHAPGGPTLGRPFDR
jgi:hypothetical protein